MTPLRCAVTMVVLSSGWAWGQALFSAEDFLDWQTERQAKGYTSAEMVPAPDRPGRTTIRVTFHATKGKVSDWLDYNLYPIPYRDLSAANTVTVDVYPEQPDSLLTIKLVDPDVPASVSANRSAAEGRLTVDGQALKAKQWNRCVVRLRDKKEYRDSLSMIGFYVPFSSLPAEGATHTYCLGILDPAASGPDESRARPKTRRLAEADFEDGRVPEWAKSTGVVTDRADAVIAGQRSLLKDSMESDQPWHEFFHSRSDKLKFEEGKRYRISFDYRITAAPADRPGRFYFMMRSGSLGIRKDLCWLRWQGASGQAGFKAVTFHTTAADDYRLTIGVQERGGLAVDNVCVDLIEP